MENQGVLFAALFFVAVFVFLLRPKGHGTLQEENSLLRLDRDKAHRRIAELEEALAERDRRTERSLQNRIQLPANQIEAVNDNTVEFFARPVMNRGEAQVFYAAQRALQRTARSGWHVFPQVSLGEIIGTRSHWEPRERRAHQSINSKRCDLLIADPKGRPMVVIEYQGSGHYQGTAEQRDAVKRIAIERAGIRFVEIPDGTHPEQIVRTILAQL
jgi:cbb3-type cytochrome oxidase subunit 3